MNKSFKLLLYPLISISLTISTVLHSRSEYSRTSFVIQKIPQDSVTPSKQLLNKPIDILFAGDTHFEWAISEMQNKNSVNYPVEEVREVFLESDFKILNLETTISNKAKPVNAKSYVFRSDISNAALLNYLGINLAVLGNNHTMDMGLDGLSDTITSLQMQGIPSTGAGLNFNDAISPFYFNLRGTSFAVISYNAIEEKQSTSFDSSSGSATLTPAIYNQIARVKKTVDHVIVSAHWGIEYSPRPEKQQIKIAHSMIDSGATAVIGHHPHIPQGIEFYKNGIIAYSLGNFLFGSINHYQTDNFLLKLLFHPEKKIFEGVRIYPITGDYKKFGHKLSILKSDKSENFWKRFYTQCYELNSRQLRISIDPRGYGTWLN